MHGLDVAWCSAFLRIVGDAPGLLAFMFHAVEDDGRDMDRDVDPAQGLSVSALDSFVAYFLASGYRFVSPDEVVAGLEPDGRYALLTFDDGYYNNVRALPVLERHGVPALFSISAGHVASGRAFWWDVVYRERAARGVSLQDIREEQLAIKRMAPDRVQEHLVAEFGASADEPRGDDDRPMTPDELRAFASEPLVHVGNHTRDHAILTRCSEEAAEEQIESCQEMLASMTGRRPIAIAYPNGDHSPAVVGAARRCGIRLGVTVEPRRGGVPTDPDEMMTISRFSFTKGNDTRGTYLGFRSSVSLRSLVRLARLRGSSGP